MVTTAEQEGVDTHPEETPAEEQRQEKKPEVSRLNIVRALLAEAIGTFVLTVAGAGAIVIADISGGKVDYVARVVSPGLAVMAMIYTLGEVSGAHINPAVTLAFALRRAFPWSRILPYWAAQVIGSFLAAGFLYFIFGNAGHVGATLPHGGDGPAFAFEILLTFILVSVIIGTATNGKIVGPNAGIAVGATIALCGLFADPISAASMNPARSLGPAVVGGQLDGLWIYLLAPFIGSLLAVGVAWLVQGPPTAKEEEAASGKKQMKSRDSSESGSEQKEEQ